MIHDEIEFLFETSKLKLRITKHDTHELLDNHKKEINNKQ